MTITLEIPEELEKTIEAEARRRGVSVQAVVLDTLRSRDAGAAPIPRPAPVEFPVFEGGIRMPHQTVEWCDNIRDVAYDDDEP